MREVKQREKLEWLTKNLRRQIKNYRKQINLKLELHKFKHIMENLSK